jgi:hypothetical protein
MHEIIINILGTIIGGLLLTLILFLLNEYCFTKINLTGEWKTIIKIENSSYNLFKGLKIEYEIHLIQKGYELSGSGEKIKDIKTDGTETIFNREKRVINSIEGYYERKYFGKSKVYLNINEEGRLRETRATYILEVENENNLYGFFKSTAGDANGSITMSKIWLKL